MTRHYDDATPHPRAIVVDHLAVVPPSPEHWHGYPDYTEQAFADAKAIELLIKLNTAYEKGIKMNGILKQNKTLEILVLAKLIYIIQHGNHQATCYISDLGMEELKKRRSKGDKNAK